MRYRTSSTDSVVICLPYAVSPYVDKPLKCVAQGQCDVRPTVTFPAVDGNHRLLSGTKLYCLVTEAHTCVNNLPKVVGGKRNRSGLKRTRDLLTVAMQPRNNFITMQATQRLTLNLRPNNKGSVHTVRVYGPFLRFFSCFLCLMQDY